MKNKLFFSSLIMIAMLLSSTNSAFSVSDNLTFRIPGYSGIEVDNSSVVSGSATRTSATNISLDNSLNVTYNVNTNEYILVGIVASVPVAGNSSKYIDLSNGYIVFTKADGSTTSSAVDDITGNNPLPANNANAIAFPITCTQTNYVLPISSNPSYGNHYRFGELSPEFLYEGSNTMQMSCTISGDSVANTVGMNDTSGNYSATLAMTHVSYYEDY